MIKFCDVSKRYGKSMALDSINFELTENKIYCLLCRNGAGKTTLLKLIAGHMNSTSGAVFVDNKKVSTVKMPDCVNFLESRTSMFNLRIYELIELANKLQDDFDLDFAKLMVKKFRLDKNKKYKQLSFGTKTMVTTLLSLSSNCKVVLLDEPTLGFDAIMRAEFYEMLSESFLHHPRIIIVSTHLIDEIAKVAENLILIDQGEILLQSTINEMDEKAYSVTGKTEDVKSVIKGHQVLSEITLAGHTTAYLFDERVPDSASVTVQTMGLQDFFIHSVGGSENND